MKSSYLSLTSLDRLVISVEGTEEGSAIEDWMSLFLPWPWTELAVRTTSPQAVLLVTVSIQTLVGIAVQDEAPVRIQLVEVAVPDNSKVPFITGSRPRAGGAMAITTTAYKLAVTPDSRRYEKGAYPTVLFDTRTL